MKYSQVVVGEEWRGSGCAARPGSSFVLVRLFWLLPKRLFSCVFSLCHCQRILREDGSLHGRTMAIWKGHICCRKQIASKGSALSHAQFHLNPHFRHFKWRCDNILDLFGPHLIVLEVYIKQRLSNLSTELISSFVPSIKIEEGDCITALSEHVHFWSTVVTFRCVFDVSVWMFLQHLFLWRSKKYIITSVLSWKPGLFLLKGHNT